MSLVLLCQRAENYFEIEVLNLTGYGRGAGGGGILVYSRSALLVASSVGFPCECSKAADSLPSPPIPSVVDLPPDVEIGRRGSGMSSEVVRWYSLNSATRPGLKACSFFGGGLVNNIIFLHGKSATNTALSRACRTACGVTWR